ncbi:MAG: serine--tRNA ligase [Sedimentisphaerales bacterium]|nr:serine--tRNA ligase [Sedimentisphaerales bacterium]
MIDIKEIRENPEKFKKACQAKHFDVDIDKLLEIDAKRRKVEARLQEITTEKNALGKSIPKLTGEEKKSALDKLKQLKEDEAEARRTYTPVDGTELEILMRQVPQPPDEDVPEGKDDTENVEMSKWGDIRKFDFEPKDHIQLGLGLDIIDIERAVKLAGTRNYFLKGAGAMLHWAVLRFAMDFMVKKGYVPFSVPMLMRNEAMTGTGYYPGAEEQTYLMERDELNLAGTAEVPLTAYFMNEIVLQEKLPYKFVGLSTCYRREAGAAGKDTYGLYRIHQFDKVEQVIICENDNEASAKFHEEIQANAEAVMQGLELPYRVVKVCTGDLGRGQAKKYDIEAWMPSRNSFGETHSASKFYDFQARRMNLRYKDGKTKKNLFCHTLNDTVIASPRILIPILELNQNKDGSVNIPKVLQPYMDGMKVIKPG